MQTHPPRWPLAGLLTVVLLALAPTACRKSPQPSEAYEQANARFGKLYAEKGEAAYGEPTIAGIEALLVSVPEDSLDAASAQQLHERIRKGRAKLQAEQAAREAAVAKAREDMNAPSPDSPEAAPTDSSGAEEPAQPPPAAPRPGTAESELASGFSGCFQKGEQIEVRHRGVRDRWELADRAECREQYPALQEAVLILEEGKVLAVVPRKSIEAIPEEAGR